jgi:D-glycero-D-manno-heptose 1,7-bisphosphate phosphatase
MNASKKTVFLDRDGVINRDSADYIKSWEEFEFLPGSLEAIKLLTEEHFTIFLITNQSVINRGMVTQSGLMYIFTKMKETIIKRGGKITDIFYCPHMPDENCSCRKPAPGMVLSAQKKYNIDLSSSYFVGDSTKDIECAKRAGCGYSILVKTGNGPEAIKELTKIGNAPNHLAENLLEAAQIIITRFNSENSV